MKRLTKLISGMPTAMAAVLILICAGLVLAFTTKEETAILEAAFDQQQYASHMEKQVGSIDHIVDQYLLDQTGYLPVATPDPDFIHIESGGILPFDPKDFPRDFTQNLLPQTKGVITTYEIIVYEDRETRERKILNSRNKIIATVKAEKGYDPMWYVKACYENVLLSDDKERIQWLTQVYDPSRIAIRYQLIEKDELIELVWEDSLQAIERTEDEGGMVLGGRGGAGVTNFSFTATEPLTNGTVQITLAWPTNGLSTNAIDIFVSTNMLEEIWQIALTTNLSTDTNIFTWIDTDACDHPARFYDCWTLHDSDGDGLSDGRERRLYLTDPQDADTDDDGMPDGWEVQYGLDPLDATGGNGANGDPDGDGFTNLQEFQMSGDPANPAINATQLIHRLMHCRGDSSLRVDVEDSENCGGTNTNRQEVEDVFNVGPLMHCGYLLSLTVEGRVEDHNSGYDKVSVRVYTATELQSEVPFFEGHNNSNACAMVDEQATTNVWFWSNSSVRLRHDTVDGLYHTDAYAEITAAAFVDIIKVDIDPTWDIVTEGADSDEFEAVVTPSGISGLTYSWSWEAIVAGGGNNPSVTFSSPNSSTTHVDQAHWYAVPDARCASNQVSEYRLWCTVSVGGVSCSNSATMSVRLVDPAAETVPEYNLTGGPSIAFNSASNWWYVSGTGTLARQVILTTNWWLHANSEFTAKLQAHEDQHSLDFINGFDGHEFVTVAEFYSRISALTDSTSSGLIDKISQEYVQYTTDEGAELESLRDGLEVRAYNVSDGVAPDYYYSNCGRFTYP